MEAASERGIVHKTFCQTGGHFLLDTQEHTISYYFTNKPFYKKICAIDRSEPRHFFANLTHLQDSYRYKHQSLVSLTVFWCSMTWRLINIPELQGGICCLSCKLLQCTPPLYHTQAWEVLDVKRLHACHPEYEIKGQMQYSANSAPVRSVTPEHNSKTPECWLLQHSVIQTIRSMKREFGQ